MLHGSTRLDPSFGRRRPQTSPIYQTPSSVGPWSQAHLYQDLATGHLREEHGNAGGRLAVAGNASEPEVPSASAVFAADTLAAAQTAAQDARRRAELVPILGGDCDLPHDLVRHGGCSGLHPPHAHMQVFWQACSPRCSCWSSQLWWSSG